MAAHSHSRLRLLFDRDPISLEREQFPSVWHGAFLVNHNAREGLQYLGCELLDRKIVHVRRHVGKFRAGSGTESVELSSQANVVFTHVVTNFLRAESCKQCIVWVVLCQFRKFNALHMRLKKAPVQILTRDVDYAVSVLRNVET